MKIDEKKRQIGIQAKEAWEACDQLGTVELATGMGKTFLALDCMVSLPKGSDVVFLAEAAQREHDLNVDIDKFKSAFGIDVREHVNLEFACYQSACKWVRRSFDLAVCDEIHDSMSPVYVQFYKNNKCKRILGLSATIKSDRTYIIDGVEVNKEILLDDIAPVCFTYDIGAGQREGTSRQLDIHVIYHRLDQIKRNVDGGNKNNPFKTTEARAYKYLDDMFWQGVYSKKDYLVKSSMMKRSLLLYSLPSKIEATKQLIKTVQGKTIIFNNDLNALEKVTTNVVRSAKKGESKKQRDDANFDLRNRFDKGNIRTIGSFKMLKQGANLKGADNVIMMSYYSSSIDMIQRIGRLRKNGNKKGNVFIFVTVGTQEEKWFKKMTDTIPMEEFNVISHLDIDSFIKSYGNNRNDT